MLTKMHIRNFKVLRDVEIDLGKSVVLVGPNNSGKTAALQALALWDAGLRRWNEKWGGKTAPEKRPGVTINRRDLTAIPVREANLLWANLHTREQTTLNGKPATKNVLIEITVEGATEGQEWRCGLEFDYANAESFYCRPLRTKDGGRLAIPSRPTEVPIAYLPPMSGLAAEEPRLDSGRVDVLIGEGQTAQVLRNLCWQIHQRDDDGASWQSLSDAMARLFPAKLLPPKYVAERGEITMSYRERSGPELDLSSSGRGLQQTLLLLAYLYANPGAVLLLDEPDAHLETLRQRQTYNLLTEIAEERGGQLIVATHSEVVLEEAADRHVVVAFVGRPHRIDDRGSQIRKSLRDIGFHDYYQAEQTGWVLYLEGSTDFSILQAFAKSLGHPALGVLERSFVHYVCDNVQAARSHFHGLRAAKPDLVGIAIFDRLPSTMLQTESALTEKMWARRELENYLCDERVLLTYARGGWDLDLFAAAEARSREEAMHEAIAEASAALATFRGLSPWSPDTKATDDFLDPLFRVYFTRLGLPSQLQKGDYHILAHLVPRQDIDPEIVEKLDAIVAVAERARPAESPFL